MRANGPAMAFNGGQRGTGPPGPGGREGPRGEAFAGGNRGAINIARLFAQGGPLVQAMQWPLELDMGFGFEMGIGGIVVGGDDDEFDDLPDLVGGGGIEDLTGARNVHDHSIASTTRKNLKRIREKCTRPQDADTVREEVTDFLLGSDQFADGVKADALEVVDSLSSTKNTSAGDSQLGALADAPLTMPGKSSKRKYVRNTSTSWGCPQA
jgi:hypothetical protein